MVQLLDQAGYYVGTFNSRGEALVEAALLGLEFFTIIDL